MIILFPILAFFLVGYIIFKILLPYNEASFFLKIALSWVFGTLAIPCQLYMYSLLKITWDPILIFAPWVFSGIFLFMKSKISYTISFKPKISGLTILGVIIYLPVFLIALTEATLHPIVSWDAVASWYFGGKAFYIDGSVSENFIRYSNNSTPPFFNLIITFLYILIGGINDRIASAIYPIYLVTGGILVYEFSKKYLRKVVAFLLSFLYITTPDILRHGGRYDVGYADLPLGVYILAVAFLLYLFIKTKSTREFIALVFVSSAAALIRSEAIPLFIILIALVVPFIISNRLYKLFYVVLCGLVLIGSWVVSVYLFHFPTNPFVQQIPDITRSLTIFIEFLKEMINFKRWNFLWLVFLLAIPSYAFLKKTYFETSILILVILQLLVYASVYMMTPVDVVSHINNSFDRLLIHLAGLAFLIIAIFISKPFKLRLQNNQSIS